MGRIGLIIRNLTLFILVIIHFPVFSEPTNLALLKNKIKSYHDSGQYNHDIKMVLNTAETYIQQRVQENQKLAHPKKLALVLDIDETSLSNYAGILHADFSADLASIHKRIMAANAPALLSTLALYEQARADGVHIFFITGRPKSECLASKINLKRTGYNHWNAIFCRPTQDHTKSIIPYKTTIRKNITEQGYTIIANIGDQQSDLEGGYAERGFKLPNPFYYLP